MLRLVIVLVVALLSACSPGDRQSGPVATADQAVLKAREAWKSIYEKTESVPLREDNTAKFEPYHATLESDIWIVRGTVPQGYRGEMLETSVRRDDGSVSVVVVRAE